MPAKTKQSTIEPAKPFTAVRLFRKQETMPRSLASKTRAAKKSDAKGKSMDDAAKDSPAHCATQLNRDKATFSRDETLPFRYGCLPKGREALEQSPAIFSQPEQAMITLGVGRNMVNAMQSCAVGRIQRRRSRFPSRGESRRSRPIPVLRPKAALLRPIFKSSPTAVCPCSTSPACIRSPLQPRRAFDQPSNADSNRWQSS